MSALSGACPRAKRRAEGSAPDPASRISPPASKRRGAPRGNLNALKSGASSKQLKELVRKLMLDPDARRLLRAFSDRRQLQNRWVEDAVNAYALQLKRQTDRAKRDRTRRYEWLPYFDENEAPF
jgi:hypothetical protein